LVLIAACVVLTGRAHVAIPARAQTPVAEEEHRDVEPAEVNAELALANFRKAGGVADWVEGQDGHLLVRRFNRKEYRIPLSKLEVLPQAKIVTLHGYDFYDDDFEVMSKWTHLEGFHVVYSEQVTDNGVKHLKNLRNLKRLALWNSALTDVGMKYLTPLSNLERLDIQYSPVTDAGLEPLKSLRKLKVLWLGGTKVTENGIQDLQESLPECQISVFD
jgi:hypothetical protein